MEPIYLLFLAASYLLGSIPFGKIIANAYGIDIQKKGSGNIGFANVQRVLGWKAGIPTLIGDVSKGMVAVYLSTFYFGETAGFFAGLCAIAGHVYPVWLRFHGGKGIATGLGVVAVLEPTAAVVGATVYVLSQIVVRVSSYSSLLGLFCTMCIATVLSPKTWWMYAVLAMIALWTLRENIQGKVPKYDT